jgi:FAD:protein FMN transferase
MAMIATLQHWLGRYSYTLAFLVLFFLWLWLRPEAPAQVYQLDGSTMGTRYQVLIAGFPESVSDQELAEGIEQRLHRLDRELMSTYAPESELSRFNRIQPGQWVDVSPELAYVVERSLHFSELTGGYFDVTVGPLVDRWGFGPDQQGALNWTRIPEQVEISRLQSLVSFQALQVSQQPPRLRKDKAVQIDLSGIAKGYAADVIADYFDSVGQHSYFIEIGGELRIKGRKPDGSAWVPAIEKPEDGVPEIWAVLNTHGESLAIAGSGDYRNYFEQDGVRYSHEIDPFTGRPVTHQLAAVNVIAEDALTADALATAFMVMGESRSAALAEQHGLAAYFIVKSPDGDGFEARYTSRFAHYLEEAP